MSKIKKLSLFSLIISMFTILFLFGCSTIGQETEKPEKPDEPFVSRVKVDAISSGDTSGQSFFIEENTESKNDLRLQEKLKIVARGLKTQGFKQSSSKASANLIVQVHFNIQKPIFGISLIGRLTPFEHEITVKAYRTGRIAWETKLIGESENESPNRVTEIIVGAGYKYFGKSTGGTIEVSVPNSNAKLIEDLRG